MDKAHIGELQQAWLGCTKCELGQLRDTRRQRQVWGTGALGGIMFIGGSPSEGDATVGQPFSGPEGEILTHLLERLEVLEYCYFAPLTICRSCSVAYNGQGEIVRDRTGSPIIRDDSPKAPQVQACLGYLLELIYLVDPVVIVAMGGDACKALTGSAVNIMSESGQAREVHIPGRWANPVITPKKQEWARTHKGVVHLPVVPNTVRYLLIPCDDNRDVVASAMDRQQGNRTDRFLQAITHAAKVYKAYTDEIAKERR